MVAFVLAGLLFVVTLVICFVMAFAAGMSDSPSASANVPVVSTFVTGTIITIMIAASHWMPHLAW